MSRSSNSEDNLLARFKALGPSSATTHSSTSIAPKPDLQNDLAVRFLAFSHQNLSDSRQTAQDLIENQDISWEVNEDDKTIEDLLADLGPSDQWMLSPDDPKNIARLIKEADVAVAASQNLDKDEVSDEPQQDLVQESQQAANELSSEVQSEAEESLRVAATLQQQGDLADAMLENSQDEEDSEAALQCILDELSLDNALVHHELIRKDNEVEPNPTAAIGDPGSVKGKGEPALYLPSVPDTTPSKQAPPQNVELILPAAPTDKPIRKHPNTNLPVYTNEDVETWCEICNDDATIRCLGCDGDLYCGSCWKEGHTGPDAGFEEKMHRWTKYTRF